MNRRLILGLLIVLALFTLSIASAADLDAVEMDVNDSSAASDLSLNAANHGSSIKDNDLSLNNVDDDSISLNDEKDLDKNRFSHENKTLSSSNDEIQFDSKLQSDKETQSDSKLQSDKETQSDSKLQADSEIQSDENQSDSEVPVDSALRLDEMEFDENEVPDVPDLIKDSTIYITSKNIYSYFEDGILKPWCSGNTIMFAEDFENLGKLTIEAENVTVQAIGCTLKNTVFEVAASNVTLSDLNLELDSEYPDNEYAGIIVYFSDVTLKNLNINYIVPKDVQAYGIYADGMEYGPINNLQILNSSINFEGHNDNAKVYNYALKLESCINATVLNNTLIASLPLKDINFGENGAQLASDLVLTVGIDGCDHLTFVGNTIKSEVNKRPQAYYPSLDSVFISRSSNSLIANNTISLTDFVSYTGVDNYLYGLDIYNLENLTVTGNNISVNTTGGKLAAGTAYPIQITGPIDNVVITYNDLYSYSYGPNIGIYSQNFYGATALTILHNNINVTGLAGKEDWALVAGIESQDTDSVIRDNIIEVHSVDEVSVDDNLYGISYQQKTDGDHKFNISQNTVFSDGYYSVNLISSVNSSVADNLLVSYNPNAKNSNGFKYGDLSSHEGIEFYNNSVVSSFDYFANRENNIDNGDIYSYNPFVNDNISNDIDGSNIFNGESEGKYSYNPLIPGSKDNWGIHSGEDGWTVKEEESPEKEDSYLPQQNDDGNSNENGMSLNQLLANYIKSNGNSTSGSVTWDDLLSDDSDNKGDGAKTNSTSLDGSNAKEAVNNSDESPSDSGKDLSVNPSQSSEGSVGDTGAVAKKAFKIDKIEDVKNKSTILPIIFMALALFCLIIGFKRKTSIFD